MAGAVCWRSGEDQRCQSRCLQGIVFFLELLLIGPLKLNGFPPFLRGVHCPKRFFEYPEIQFPGSKTSSFNKLLWER